MVYWLNTSNARLPFSRQGALAPVLSLAAALKGRSVVRSLPDKRIVPTCAAAQRDRELVEKVRFRRRILIGTAAAQLLAASAAAVWFLQRPNSGVKALATMSGFFGTLNRSQEELVKGLQREERVTDKTAQTMLQVDRRYFLDPDQKETLDKAYQDHPLSIGYGETISAPHMHAEALRLLENHCPPGATVLDVGSGSGYLTGCFGIMVGDNGQVLGVEKHKELAHRSIASLQAAVPELMKKGTIKIMPGNVLGKVLGTYGPFDAIHVGAAAATMPKNLIEKLKPGGRMVIPVGAQNDDYQVLKLVDKDRDGKVQERDLMQVRFVPLTEPGTDPYVGKDEE